MQSITTENIAPKPVIGVTVGDGVPPLRMTYEEFLDWNGTNGVWAEWVAGEVILMSNPSLKHQDVSDFLTSLMRFYAEAKQLGKVVSAPFQIKFDFKPSGRQPDILFVATENLATLHRTFVDGTADLAVEIISPESRTRDRGDKFFEYEQARVKEYWVIDPDRKQAEFYVLDADGVFQFAAPENGVFHSRVLDGLFLRVEWLWQEPLPAMIDVLKNWKLI